jgi:uncharacterized membrane protein
MKTTTNARTMKMVQLALFTAIIALMAFTPIGYIRTPGLQITLFAIPVAVGAIILGPVSGAILGGVFGITSFIQCFGIDALGTFLLGVNPVGTFLFCMVPRILMGGLAGLIFKGLKKIDKTKGISYAVTSLAASLMNSVFFLGSLLLFIYLTNSFEGIKAEFAIPAKSAIAFILSLATINIIFEAIACLIVGTAVSKALDIFRRKTGNAA